MVLGVAANSFLFAVVGGGYWIRLSTAVAVAAIVAQVEKPYRCRTLLVSGIQLSRRMASFGSIKGKASRLFHPPIGGGSTRTSNVPCLAGRGGATRLMA